MDKKNIVNWSISTVIGLSFGAALVYSAISNDKRRESLLELPAIELSGRVLEENFNANDGLLDFGRSSYSFIMADRIRGPTQVNVVYTNFDFYQRLIIQNCDISLKVRKENNSYYFLGDNRITIDCN